MHLILNIKKWYKSHKSNQGEPSGWPAQCQEYASCQAKEQKFVFVVTNCFHGFWCIRSLFFNRDKDTILKF